MPLVSTLPVYVPNGPALQAIVDPDCLSFGRWRWHAEPGRAYVVRYTTRTGFRRIYLHREVLGLAPDDPRRVDHINRNPLDNRRGNLRVATDAENAQNQGSRGGSSQYRGVTWDKSRGKWMATAMLNGRRRTLGRFDSEDEAAARAAAWRREHMPFSVEPS